MTLVAGIDSSTQSCKVVIRDAETGKLVRQGRASHPDGTEVHPDAWWSALQSAIEEAGGLDDVAAASVAGQQHGMVVLDSNGEVVRPALLWNDTRSAGAAASLISELGGAQQWADAVGIAPREAPVGVAQEDVGVAVRPELRGGAVDGHRGDRLVERGHRPQGAVRGEDVDQAVRSLRAEAESGRGGEQIAQCGGVQRRRI